MSTTPLTETVPSSALREGDVVRTHGMRVRLGRVTNDGGPRPTFRSRAEVLTTEAEVRKRRTVPWSWLVEDGPTPTWTVQGNDFTAWVREVA